MKKGFILGTLQKAGAYLPQEKRVSKWPEADWIRNEKTKKESQPIHRNQIRENKRDRLY